MLGRVTGAWVAGAILSLVILAAAPEAGTDDVERPAFVAEVERLLWDAATADARDGMVIRAGQALARMWQDDPDALCHLTAVMAGHGLTGNAAAGECRRIVIALYFCTAPPRQVARSSDLPISGFGCRKYSHMATLLDIYYAGCLDGSVSTSTESKPDGGLRHFLLPALCAVELRLRQLGRSASKGNCKRAGVCSTRLGRHACQCRAP